MPFKWPTEAAEWGLAVSRYVGSQMPAQDAQGRFITGNNGGPGRPRGTRPKYAEAFIADFYEEWLEYGRDAVRKVRTKSPVDFLRAAVAILPKDVHVNVSIVESMSDDELSATIRRLSADIRRAEAVVCGDADGEAAQDSAYEALQIQAISETS